MRHFFAATAARLLGWYLRFALATTRWRIEGGREIRRVAEGGGMVAAFWHECLPAALALWLRCRRLAPGRPAAMLVSRHRDGQFVAATLQPLGLRALHGSSGRPGKRDKGGARGLLAMLEALEGGALVVLTPDGPRGPRRVAAGGAGYLAARAGAPLVPLAARTAWHVTLPSWDRMQMPLPFGRGAAVCLKPADPAAHVGAALDTAVARAEALLRAPGPPWQGAAWQAAATLATPVLPLLLRRRAAAGREDRARLPERAGRDTTPRPPGRLLWLHAASLGESQSVLPLLAALPERVLLTTGTVTSARLLTAQLPALGLADRVLHRFAPWDVPAWIARFLDHWRPDAAAFVESELWPNQLAACRAREIPLALLNGRLSARSAARWAHMPRFARHVLGSFAWIAAQSPADAARFAALGATGVDAPGNLKDAAEPLAADPATLAQLAARLADRPRWLAASTHPGEEALIARVHARLAPAFPGLLTVIVPRHPARGASLAIELGASRRSQAADPPAGGLWLADTLGELGLFYRLVPTVFMGKSFGAGGGQNPLEPARLGCALATGPATANFAAPVARLRAAGALIQVADEAELADWVAAMVRDPDARARAGAAARAAAAPDSALPRLLAARLHALLDAGA